MPAMALLGGSVTRSLPSAVLIWLCRPVWEAWSDSSVTVVDAAPPLVTPEDSGLSTAAVSMSATCVVSFSLVMLKPPWAAQAPTIVLACLDAAEFNVMVSLGPVSSTENVTSPPDTPSTISTFGVALEAPV